MRKDIFLQKRLSFLILFNIHYGFQIQKDSKKKTAVDQWSTAVCNLKYESFRSEFPEVNDPQFLWACERWIQLYSSKDFAKVPTWAELMVPLYATENGRANRSWGFKRDLPGFAQPTAQQQSLLPTEARSIAAAADPHNADAYQLFHFH